MDRLGRVRRTTSPRRAVRRSASPPVPLSLCALGNHDHMTGVAAHIHRYPQVIRVPARKRPGNSPQAVPCSVFMTTAGGRTAVLIAVAVLSAALGAGLPAAG